MSAMAGIGGSKSSRVVDVWDGKVRLSLPSLAENPQPISQNIFSISPSANRPELKYVIFVVREPLRAGEVALSNESLKKEVGGMLEAAGYEVIGITNFDNTFLADFRAVIAPGTLPWQKVGPGMARGKAKFVRTSEELVGSVLLCDPSQWKNKTTQLFINVVEDTSVVP